MSAMKMIIMKFIKNSWKVEAVLLLTAAASLIFLYYAHAFQNENQGEGKEIILRHADSLLGQTQDGETIRKYSGNVSFSQGSVLVNCDNAIHYIDRNEARLFGNVIIYQEGLVLKAPLVNYFGNTGRADARLGVEITNKKAVLTADSGVYSTETKIADFEGNVLFKDDTVSIKSRKMKYFKQENISRAFGDVFVDDDSAFVLCDTLEYFRETRDSRAFGNVRIIGKYERVILTGDTIINITSENYTEALGAPVLFQIDSIKKSKLDFEYWEYDTLSIASDTMRAFKSGSRDMYHFIGHVELRKNSVAAKAGFGDYNMDGGYFRLEKSPVLWYDSTQLHADTIIVHLPDNKLKEISAFGNAFSALKNDSLNLKRINQLSGEEIKIIFERDSIAAINGFGDAKSLYYMVSEKGPDGAARNGADSIFISFSAGEADEILWLGAVQGEYFPENIIFADPKSYYLPGFKWSADIPKKKALPVIRIEQ